MEPRPLNLGCFRWRGSVVRLQFLWMVGTKKAAPRSRLASRVRSKRADLLGAVGRRALQIDPNVAAGFEVAVLIERWRTSADTSVTSENALRADRAKRIEAEMRVGPPDADGDPKPTTPRRPLGVSKRVRPTRFNEAPPVWLLMKESGAAESGAIDDPAGCVPVTGDHNRPNFNGALSD
jgi:hypothetical protein